MIEILISAHPSEPNIHSISNNEELGFTDIVDFFCQITLDRSQVLFHDLVPVIDPTVSLRVNIGLQVLPTPLT